jgi:hypothetical protein
MPSFAFAVSPVISTDDASTETLLPSSHSNIPAGKNAQKNIPSFYWYIAFCWHIPKRPSPTRRLWKEVARGLVALCAIISPFDTSAEASSSSVSWIVASRSSISSPSR